jgi:hypothetical protein
MCESLVVGEKYSVDENLFIGNNDRSWPRDMWLLVEENKLDGKDMLTEDRLAGRRQDSWWECDQLVQERA